MIFFFLIICFLGSVTGTCPGESITVPQSYGSKWKCLQFVTSENFFFSADTYCRTEYQGHLISVSNGFFNFFIPQVVGSLNQNSSRFWIGVSNLYRTGWINIDDNSETSYFDWAPGEPADFTISNGCVSMDSRGMWYNDNCVTKYPFVCGVPEIGDNSTPQPTSTYDPVSPCYSYIPFAIDTTDDFSYTNFVVLKDFLVTHFLPELFPINLQPTSYITYNCDSINGYMLNNLSSLTTWVNDTWLFDLPGSCLDWGTVASIYLGVFNYKDNIPINFVIFTGTTAVKNIYEFQYSVSFLATHANSVTIVLANPGLNSTNIQYLNNVNIVQWSDNSTELLMNIRKNMKCGGGSPVYHPCKSWFSFVTDSSNSLSMTDFETQKTFISYEISRMNRPDRIQIISGAKNGPYLPWYFPLSIMDAESLLSFPSSPTVFSLKHTLQVLYDWYSKYSFAKEPPIVALVFIGNTTSYENYGGADEVVQKLKGLGYRLTFILMGPDVDESKLTNYTTNFVYWRNLTNTLPENWNAVRLDAYGCTD